MKRDAPRRSHTRYKLHNRKRYASKSECIPIRICCSAQKSQNENPCSEDKHIRPKETGRNRSNRCAEDRSHEALAGHLQRSID